MSSKLNAMNLYIKDEARDLEIKTEIDKQWEEGEQIRVRQYRDENELLKKELQNARETSEAMHSYGYGWDFDKLPK